MQREISSPPTVKRMSQYEMREVFGQKVDTTQPIKSITRTHTNGYNNYKHPISEVQVEKALEKMKMGTFKRIDEDKMEGQKSIEEKKQIIKELKEKLKRDPTIGELMERLEGENNESVLIHELVNAGYTIYSDDGPFSTDTYQQIKDGANFLKLNKVTDKTFDEFDTMEQVFAEGKFHGRRTTPNLNHGEKSYSYLKPRRRSRPFKPGQKSLPYISGSTGYNKKVDIANELEQSLGRKPTIDELMNKMKEEGFKDLEKNELIDELDDYDYRVYEETKEPYLSNIDGKNGAEIAAELEKKLGRRVTGQEIIDEVKKHGYVLEEEEEEEL